MDKRHLRILTVLMILMVLLTALNVAISFLNKQHPDVLKNAIRKEIESIKIPEAPLPNIPVKGVDYFDGKDGAKGEKGDKGDKGDKGEAGKDSFSTHTVEKVIIKEESKPIQIPIPTIRCNESKNRWEVKHTDTWNVIFTDLNKPVKCINNAASN